MNAGPNLDKKFSPPQQGRVIIGYESAYPDPLVLQAGEEITVGANDTQWPGFVWCTNQAGKGGWVPESYIERHGPLGTMCIDYSGAELTANAGEELTIEDEESGWYWCMNQNQEWGWIPKEHVAIL